MKLFTNNRRFTWWRIKSESSWKEIFRCLFNKNRWLGSCTSFTWVSITGKIELHFSNIGINLPGIMKKSKGYPEFDIREIISQIIEHEVIHQEIAKINAPKIYEEENIVHMMETPL